MRVHLQPTFRQAVRVCGVSTCANRCCRPGDNACAYADIRRTVSCHVVRRRSCGMRSAAARCSQRDQCADTQRAYYGCCCRTTQVRLLSCLWQISHPSALCRSTHRRAAPMFQYRWYSEQQPLALSSPLVENISATALASPPAVNASGSVRPADVSQSPGKLQSEALALFVKVCCCCFGLC